MRSLFKKKEEVEINLYSVCKGSTIEIGKVPDKMFAEKLLGDGVGFHLDDTYIYAPCDGNVVMIANTKHAIGIQTKNGAEILIHVGMDTVNLNGKGFSLKVKTGEKIKQGQCLLEIDLEFMNKNKIDLTTPVILTSQDEYSLKILKNNNIVSTNDVVAILKKI